VPTSDKPPPVVPSPNKPPLVRGGNATLDDYRNSIGRYTIAEGTFKPQLDHVTCVPSVLEQAIGVTTDAARADFARMYQLAKNQGGYTLEQAVAFLRQSHLSNNAEYVPTISMLDLAERAKTGKFTVINVKGSASNLQHAVGVSGYEAGKGFLIHDPLLGNYHQPYSDLLSRLGTGALINIK
jgi:hypothetical protein